MLYITQALDRDREEDEPEEFVYPYHLGWKENLKQVFTCTGKPRSDGFSWDVVEGCDQFTFTVSRSVLPLSCFAYYLF